LPMVAPAADSRSVPLPMIGPAASSRQPVAPTADDPAADDPAANGRSTQAAGLHAPIPPIFTF
ncbi:hypothetical protein P4H42_04305, partial [Paenibacillus macerans]|uniref:hypothetical protein n=1 Tax=Paenibacillus macerans TaxID=44252 RepID=UPI002DB8A2CD